MIITNQYVQHHICHRNGQILGYHCMLQYLQHAQHYNHLDYDRLIGKTNIAAHFLYHENRDYFDCSNFSEFTQQFNSSYKMMFEQEECLT